MDVAPILEGLNPEQRRAVETARGPVCILAGAGSGKTTTITRRIAYQVATGEFPASAVLAVTFTDKAATELRERLTGLGVGGVVARTFHAAALGQLKGLSAEPVGRLLPSKAMILRQIGNTLPKPYRFRPAGDLATEVEWAKNRRLTPSTYRETLLDHEPPIPDDLMARVFGEYERRKQAGGHVDFEDLLELAIRLFDSSEEARTRFRERYRAFTVDEYQDVNLLQQQLLERWLGVGDELCAVGDDYQSIYSFTGASPEYLLAMPQRFPHAAVIRLESNYRSTPQVLELANRLVPRLGGSEKVLRPTQEQGPVPAARTFASREAELSFVAERVKALHAEGVPYEEIAVLYRLNARSEDYEEALVARGIPYQVRGGAFLARQAARRLLKALEGVGARDVAGRVREAALHDGWEEEPPEGLGEQEATRQADLKRLVRLAEEFEGRGTVAEFLADLEARFGDAGGRGVNLLSYHRAKGLEFAAVFLPRLEEKELPARQAKTDAAVQEERRLLYVGMTRARRHLFLTWAGRPSCFLRELGLSAQESPRAAAAPAQPRLRDSELPPAARALRSWRLERARADGVPPYVVFPDKTLEEIVRTAPRTPADLARVHGLGSSRLERYGPELLKVVRAAFTDGDAPDPTFSLRRPEPRPKPEDELYHALAAWRRTRAVEDEVPPFHVLANRTLEEIVRRSPRTLDELAEVPGIGPAKLKAYGKEVLATLGTATT